MIKNTKKFLVISFSILISVCIVMFTITSVYVSVRVFNDSRGKWRYF